MSANTIPKDISFSDIVRAIKYDSSNNIYYIGGDFSSLTIGGIQYNANGIVAITPSSTPVVRQLGTGLQGYCYAIAISGSNVYVGGLFTSARDASGETVTGTSRIARWDGTSWSAMGSGLNTLMCWSVAVSGSNVYVGGSFTSVLDSSGVAVTGTLHIARWDGTAWYAMGGGLPNSCFAIDTSGSDVYVGGGFAGAYSSGTTLVSDTRNIARWDGSNWNAIGPGLSGTCRSIKVSGTDVYAGGDFSSVATNIPIPETSRIARWDGSQWNPLTGGISNGSCYAIDVRGSDVFVCGSFTTIGGVSIPYAARWNKDVATWYSTKFNLTSANVPYAILVANDMVYIGGSDTQTNAFFFSYSLRIFSLTYSAGSLTTWDKVGNNASSHLSGNVGIGLTNPSSKIDVSGDMTVTELRYGSLISTTTFPRWDSGATELTSTKTVGIGTTTNVTGALTVSGNVAVSSNLTVGSAATSSQSILDITGSIRSGLPSVATKAQYSSYTATGTTSIVDVSLNSGGRSGGNFTAEGGLNATTSIAVGKALSGNYVLDVSGSIYMKKYLVGINGRLGIQPELARIRALPESPNSGLSPYIATYFAYINDSKQVVVNSIHNSYAISFAATGDVGVFTEQVYSLPVGELASKVYTTGQNMYVLTESGKILSIGYNVDGQCALKINGTSINTSPINSLVQGFTNDSSNNTITSPFTKVIVPTDLDGLCVFALTQGRRLYGAGWNISQQLATGNSSSSHTLGGPQLVQFSGIGTNKDVSDAICVGGWEGTNHRPTLIVLDTDGAVWGCGFNGAGNVGQNNTATVNYSQLLRIKSSATADLSSGMVAIYGSGITGNTSIFALHSSGDLYVWGQNSTNTRFDGTTAAITTAKKINSSFGNEAVTRVWTGFEFNSGTFVQTASGKVYATGLGNALGINSTSSTTGWQQLTFFNSSTRILDELYIGHTDTDRDIVFARTRDTSGNYSLWVTGKNDQGSAGIGMTSDIRTWIEVALPSSVISHISRIISSNWGSRFSVATGTTVILLDDGTAYIAGKHIPLSNNDTIFSKFVPLCRYLTSDEPN